MNRDCPRTRVTVDSSIVRLYSFCSWSAWRLVQQLMESGGTGNHLVEKKRMKLVKPHSVEAAIRTLSQQERQKVFAWFTHLANWENDPHTREMSKPSVDNDVYVLNTSDDIRIFFKLDLEMKEITVLDIAKPSRFATAGRASE